METNLEPIKMEIPIKSQTLDVEVETEMARVQEAQLTLQRKVDSIIAENEQQRTEVGGLGFEVSNLVIAITDDKKKAKAIADELDNLRKRDGQRAAQNEALKGEVSTSLAET